MLRFVAEMIAYPPHHRIPPVDRGHQQFAQADPMIVSPQVSEFVAKDGPATGFVQFGPQLDGKKDPRAPSEANHGGNVVINH